MVVILTKNPPLSQDKRILSTKEQKRVKKWSDRKRDKTELNLHTVERAPEDSRCSRDDVQFVFAPLDQSVTIPAYSLILPDI